MRKLRFLLFLAATFIAEAAPPADAPPLPLEELKPGSKGQVWTVFRGTEPEPFDVVVTGVLLNALGPGMGELLGGSADLTGSVNTLRKDSKPVTPADVSGNYLYYGVREFAMTAMMNGLALHGGFAPYAGTFLVFSDYARNAVRLAALMHQRVLLVYTHDSIGLVEDGEAAEGGGFRGNAVTLSFEILGDDRNRQDERDDGHDGEDATDDHTQLLRRGPCC